MKNTTTISFQMPLEVRVNDTRWRGGGPSKRWSTPELHELRGESTPRPTQEREGSHTGNGLTYHLGPIHAKDKRCQPDTRPREIKTSVNGSNTDVWKVFW